MTTERQLGTLRAGACQTPEILGDIDAALTCLEDFARHGDDQDVDLLVFPECFLQGYLPEQSHVSQQALDLRSAGFAAVLRRLVPVEQTLVVGIIERNGDRYFNTAAVIVRGRLSGSNRKTNLMPGETVFHPGSAHPTFQAGDARFGINICSDTQIPGPAAQIAAQGARLLLVPAQNMLRHDTALRWKDRHHEIRAQRARETGMWLVSADVPGTRGDQHIAYGPTSVISPDGEVVEQVPLMTTGLAVADIR
jgi:predicted amidohydrolase